jgi:hypothetical protein
MGISSYAQHHRNMLLFMTCASNFNFFCAFSIYSVISRYPKIHICLVCTSYMLNLLVLFLP